MKERIEYLLNKWIDKTASDDDRKELLQLVSTAENDEEIKLALDAFYFGMQTDSHLTPEKAESIFEAITGRKVVKMERRRWIKWIAAASIIIVIATTALVISNQWGTKSGSIGEKSPFTTDVPAPTNTRAVITLANGSKVYLDSAGNGILAQENNVNVVRNEKGEIIYSPDHQITKSPIAYNTLFNPRGSKVISLTLSDGTKVWLNSESSLRYPASFAPSAVTREVEITGEAYFEVAHNPAKPFHVKKDGTDITVLGTHFNVNAYNDEDALRVTLLEGLVKVTHLSPAGGGDLRNTPNYKRPGVVIKPGEQAIVKPNSPLTTDHSPDLDAVMSWKNGRFYYDGVNIKTIMKEISRWYNVEVEYKDDINYSFVAKISRDVPVSQLLKIIELTDLVHFKIEGNKIIVSQ